MFTAAVMLFLTPSGGTVVRTARIAPGQGLWANGTSISGNSSRCGPPFFTSRYTPTICHSMPGPSFVTPGMSCSTTMRWPRGSTSARNFFTNA